MSPIELKETIVCVASITGDSKTHYSFGFFLPSTLFSVFHKYCYLLNVLFLYSDYICYVLSNNNNKNLCISLFPKI